MKRSNISLEIKIKQAKAHNKNSPLPKQSALWYKYYNIRPLIIWQQYKPVLEAKSKALNSMCSKLNIKKKKTLESQGFQILNSGAVERT